MRGFCLSLLLGLLALTSFACETGGLPDGWRETPIGSGPVVMWDISAEPLPEVPLPNDVATWPDPTSPTGRRINASMIAPTSLEQITRQYFDELDGWGTMAPITVRFQDEVDVADMIDRQGANRFGPEHWGRHAVYVINLETGIPIPLDVNGGNNQYVLRDTNRYWDNDQRSTENNILFETVEEDVNGNGVLDPGEDTDFDGVLDHPNTIDGLASGTPAEMVDRMLWFYERETNTMLLRPVIPLEEQTKYAVVITDRLMGMGGQPIRSPFQHVHHVSQAEVLAPLPAIFAERPEIYGDLADRGWEGVAFTWSFTTQSITGDLFALRDGLYGRGPFARLAEEFPPDLIVSPLRGEKRMSAFACDPSQLVDPYVISFEDLRDTLDSVGRDAFELGAGEIYDLLQTMEGYVSHFAIAFVEAPYLLGDPREDNLYERWQMDRLTGEARISRDLVPMIIVVPKETETARQPFPVTFYGHGYTSMFIESLGFAGMMAQQGVATVGINAQGHGLALDPLLKLALDNIFARECLYGMATAVQTDRAIDHNGDGEKDSAGLYWTSYVFHTRDVVRQSVLDHMVAIRALRHFGVVPGADGPRMNVPATVIPPPEVNDQPLEWTGDVDGDGAIDAAGDFDGDGIPDIGTWDNAYHAWGQSLGGILSMLLVGAEPAVVSAAPTAGAGGMIDVGVRSTQGGVREAVILRTMGPLVVGATSAGPDRRTSCAEGERYLRFVVPDVNDDRFVEFACVPADELGEGDVVIVRNLINREVRCAAADAQGRFRVGLPSDTEDLMQVEIYDGGWDRIRYGEECEWTGQRPALVRQVDTWEVGNGGDEGQCRECASYQGKIFEVGSPLVTVTEGFGMARQTPDLRRFLGLAQIALDPGDPANYARNTFLRPLAFPDVNDGVAVPRNVLVVNTIGDMNVPLNGGNAYARAAGVLPFMPADAPEAFHEWRAPPGFAERFGASSPNQLLIDRRVFEGVARLERWPVEGVSDFLFDIDDLGEGRQWFRADGARQLEPGDPEEPAYRPARAEIPLRWVRESRAMSHAGDFDVFDPIPGDRRMGISGLLNAMIVPEGQHGFDAPNSTKVWDESVYLAELLGWYFASGGTELLYHSDPAGHQCLEEQSCHYPGE